jgi:hypothetical protein
MLAGIDMASQTLDARCELLDTLPNTTGVTAETLPHRRRLLGDAQRAKRAR